MSSGIAFLGTVSTEKSAASWLIKPKVNDSDVLFRVDTGADVTVVSEELFKEESFGKLQKTSKILLGPGQDSLQVKGMCTVKISTKSKTTTQYIYVISGLKMALPGRPAIHALGIISRIDTVNLDGLESVKRQFPDLFQGLGKMQGEYDISLKPDAKPFSLSTPHRIPLPLMSKVKQELEHMENQGIIIIYNNNQRGTTN